VFEASIAGEVLRSVLTVNYANMVADFILAESAALEAVADHRQVPMHLSLLICPRVPI
jgi:hypothetical protein